MSADHGNFKQFEEVIVKRRGYMNEIISTEKGKIVNILTDLVRFPRNMAYRYYLVFVPSIEDLEVLREEDIEKEKRNEVH